MTEIPEHLLKRSKERRAALGLEGGGDAAEAAPAGGAVEKATPAAAPVAAAAPAVARPAKAPAAAAAPPPPPPRPEVLASLQRKKIPFWAAPVLALLPIWAFVYALTLDPPTREDPVLAEAAAAYGAAGCGGCHGATGGGGVGPAFSGGAIGETFSDFEDQAEWIQLGTNGWAAENGPTYGDNEKPVGGGGIMPAFGDLDEETLMLIIRHERETLGGLPPEEELLIATGVEPEEATALVEEAAGGG